MIKYYYMRSIPFVLYSIMVILTFLPVAIIGVIAEISAYLQSALSGKRKHHPIAQSEFAIN